MQLWIKDAVSAFVTWKINNYAKSKLKTCLRNQKVSVAKLKKKINKKKKWQGDR